MQAKTTSTRLRDLNCRKIDFQLVGHFLTKVYYFGTNIQNVIQNVIIIVHIDILINSIIYVINTFMYKFISKVQLIFAYEWLFFH